MTDNTKRIASNGAKLYAIDSILPEHLRENTRFVEFLREYFNWMQLDKTSPVSVINRLNEYRNLDLVDENFIKYLEKECAISIPGNLPDVDKRKLYKQVNDIYRAKGSIPSFEALFNLLYGDEIEMYYPRQDLMRLSDGNWSEENSRYLNKGSFLSNQNYIQDSYYYQEYSYVIKTRRQFDNWESPVKKLLHPSGFALFGRVVITSEADVKKLKSPKVQLGSTFTSTQYVIPVYSNVVIASSKVVEVSSFLHATYMSISNKFGPSFALLDKIKFLIDQPMKIYKSFTLEQAKNGYPFNILPSSVITTSSV